jgi:flagellar assembly protein FliH
LERLVFKTDASLTRGGCLLESLTCSVDATIETQVESMKDFLREQPDLLPTPLEE